MLYFPAYLTEAELSLQELAADSDHLVPTLVDYLCSPPDPSSDLVLQHHLDQFDRFNESAYLLLASLSSKKEEIRCKVTSENMMKTLFRALCGTNAAVKVAAVR